METDNATLAVLTRIAHALERLSPIPEAMPDLNSADCWLWHGERQWLEPVLHFKALPLDLLQGVSHVRDILFANTLHFAKGLPANSTLLWGARGMGKSSLVKSVFAAINAEVKEKLALIEIHREDLPTISKLLEKLRSQPRRFILFCDDLSFDKEDGTYKSLKAVLDGSLAGKPENVIFYATSNRRHLMPREMVENESQHGIHPSEAVEEKVSLSDRFGLWLGFYSCDLATYLAMIDEYATYFGLEDEPKTRHASAIEWASTRGGRSGRVAWQFMCNYAANLGKRLQA